MKSKKLKVKSPGFTLVELLIVIALISVLAVALVATLNPIEQINKARDSRFQNDAAEVLSAIERYYATQLFYPWEDEIWGEGAGFEEDDNVALNSRMPGVGVCYGAAMATELADGTGCIDTNADPQQLGELIGTDELKTSFAGKEPFATDDITFVDKLYIWREANTSGTYVCYVPKANSNRKLASKLYDLAATAGEAGAVPSDMTAVTEQGVIDLVKWADATDALYRCVPE